ncbi:MAG: cobalamin B12-binding domain-containing protein [Chloroflexota bacterium]|nr:MAG: cobalamin B12-binding domain-containing protein [Chloroflexota bacterium]
MTSKHTPRVVLAKVGRDGHDVGAVVIAMILRDAGMEVMYTGLFQTPEQIVESAIQEDADVIGVSMLAGAPMVVFEKIMKLLKENHVDDIAVVGGGVIPTKYVPELKKLGVREWFLPGSKTEDIVACVRSLAAEKNAVTA